MKESAIRWAQLAATITLTLSVIVFGMTIASRQQAILDFAVAKKMQERLDESTDMMAKHRALSRMSDKKSEDSPVYVSLEKVSEYYDQQVEKMRAKYPGWYLPENLRMK